MQKADRGQFQNEKLVFIDVVLEYPELEQVRKIFKYNIQILDLLIQNVELIDSYSVQGQIKDLQFKLHEFIHWKNSSKDSTHYYTIIYRQIHLIIKKNLDFIIKSFKNMYQKHGQNHRDYFQIILESFGCLFYHLFPNDEKLNPSVIKKVIPYARSLNKAFFNLVLEKVIILLEQDKVEFFHLLYDKEEENKEKGYLLTIIKGIFRTIKYKIKVHQERFEKDPNLILYKTMYIDDVQEVTIDLIIVLIQQVYKKSSLFNYLYILKIVFNTAFKSKSFLNTFMKFCEEKNFRLLDFLKVIFTSNILELKTVAIEFLQEFPYDPKQLLQKHYPDVKQLDWFIDMLIFAIDSKETVIAVKSWHTLMFLLRYYDKKQIEILFNNKLRELFDESLKITNIPYQKFSFLFKRNPNQEYFYKLKLIVRLFDKYSEMIRNARTFILFDFKNHTKENLFFKFKDCDDKEIFEKFELEGFLMETVKQLRFLKKQPWFHNLNTSSKNFNYLYNNKINVCISMDKLFKFLLSLIQEIEIPIQYEEKNNTYKNILESLYLICFFLRIFKVTDINQQSSDELEEMKSIFEKIMQKQIHHQFLISFLMKSCFTYLDLSFEQISNPLYDLSRELILKILNKEIERENLDEFKTEDSTICQKNFVNAMIDVFNQGDYHSLASIFDILQNNILNNFEKYLTIQKLILKHRENILLSLIQISKKLDFTFNLKLNSTFLDLFETLSLFIIKNCDKNLQSDICNFFQDLNNFEEIQLLERKIQLEKICVQENLIDIKFSNWIFYIKYYAKFFIRSFEVKSEEFDKSWSIKFIKSLTRFLRVLQYGLENNFFHQIMIDISLKKENQMLDIFLLFLYIKQNNIKFSEQFRDGMNFLLKPSSLPDQEFIANTKIFYHNEQLAIHVDEYDFTIKIFSDLIVAMVNFLYDFAIKTNDYKKMEKNYINGNFNQNQSEEIFEDLNKKTEDILCDLSFRQEKKITQAVYGKVKNFLKYTKNNEKVLVKKIFIPFKLIRDQKITIPILNVYFKQLKNYYSLLDIDQVQKIMEKYMEDEKKEFIKKLQENDELQFTLLKKFYQIQNWLKVNQNQREKQFDELKNAMDIELSLQKLTNNTQSIYEELLLMINKQSNSFFFYHIQNNVSVEVLNNKMDKFYLIYDMFKQKNSICMRERISREAITESAISEIQQNRQNLTHQEQGGKETNFQAVWLPLLYQITRNSFYFFKSKNFHKFAYEMLSILLQDPKSSNMLSPIKNFFEPKSLYMKCLKNYIKKNPFDKCFDYYLSYFLLQKNYSLKSEILKYIKPFRNNKQEMKFIAKIEKALEVILRNNNQNENCREILLYTFYLNQISIRYLEFLSESSMQKLMNFCTKTQLFKETFQNASNSQVVAVIKFLAILHKKYKGELQFDDNLKFLFTYTWNNIAHPKDGDDKIRNICILMVTTLLNKHRTQVEESYNNLPKPLFDTILMDTKILDNESKLIWLESMKLLLEAYSKEREEWFKDMIASHDFNESSFSPKCWWFIIEMREFFGKNFIEYMNQKFFGDFQISLHESFDCLLILLTFLVKQDDSQTIIQLSEDKKQKILNRLLDNYVKECQEQIHEDKFFNLLLIYLKLFDEVNLNFTDISNYFLVAKASKKQNEDCKYPKFAKITTLNLRLIYYYLIKNKNHIKFEIYTQYVLNFIPNHKANTEALIYIKQTQIPIMIFNLMKICFSIKNNLPPLKKLTFQVFSQFSRERRDMMIGVFCTHFLLENISEIKDFKVVNIEKMLDHVLNHISTDKKNMKLNQQRHYVHGMFDIVDDIILPHQYSFLALYKFFAITLIKALVLSFKNGITEEDYKFFLDVVKKISQKLSYDNKPLKNTLLNLIHGLLFPNEPIKGWEFYTSNCLNYEQKCELLLAVQINEKLIQKEYCNPQFIVILNEYFGLLLKFMDNYPLQTNICSFITNQAFNMFILLDEDKKEQLVEKLGYIVKFELFDIFNFFLANFEADKLSTMVLHKEGNDIFGLLTIFFSRHLKTKSEKIELFLNNQFITNKKQVYSEFLGFLESKGFNLSFSKVFVKNLFKKKLEESTQEEIDKFVTLIMETLIDDQNLLYYDYIQIILILLQLSENFINSDLIIKALKKNENPYEILAQVKDQKNLTDKEILLIQSIADKNSELFVDENLLLDEKISPEQKEELKNLITNIEINKQFRKYEKIRDSIENYLSKQNDGSKPWNAFSVKEEILEKYIVENWIDAKKHLAEWEDLDKVSKDTENFDLKLETTKINGDFSKKLFLLESDCKPRNECLGIVDLASTIIEKMDMIDNIEDIKLSKQKDLLFVYNLFFQHFHNIKLSRDNLIKVLNNHQLTNEFQQGFDIFLRNNSQDMAFQLSEWRKKLPSIEREPYDLRNIISQRIFFSEQFYDYYLHRLGNLEEINNQEKNNKILDNPLYNKMQILKIERLHKIPFTIHLNSFVYDEEKLKEIIVPAIYKLYKENCYQGFEENIQKIQQVIKIHYKGTLQMKFKIFDLKMQIKQNNLEKSFELAQEISQNMDNSCVIGKYYQYIFELLYQYMTQTETYHEELLRDLFDAMAKALAYDYLKNSKKLFYKFMLIIYLFPYKQKQTFEQIESQENKVLEDQQMSLNKTIKNCLKQIPMKIFKDNILEICSFLANNPNQYNNKDNILNSILTFLVKENPFCLYYTLESFKKLIGTKFFNELESQIKKDLPRKALRLEKLGKIVEKYSDKMKVTEFLIIEKIIENFYKNGKLDTQLSELLFQKQPSIKEAFLEIQQKQISSLEKILSVIIFLEKWMKENQPEKKIFVSDLLKKNEIYLVNQKTPILQTESNHNRKRYFIQPYIYILEEDKTLNLMLKLFDERKKKKLIRIKPLNVQRRQMHNFSQKIDGGIFLLHEKLHKLHFNLFFQNILTRSVCPDLPQNFNVLSENWYIIENMPSISLLRILNSYYDPNDFENIHLSFKNRGLVGESKAIEQMLKIYPKNVFKNYLIQNLQIPEQVYYISERIANSIAYDAFMRHVFGFENHFLDAQLNTSTGHVYFDINSNFNDKGSPFTPRITPNFQELFTGQILKQQFLSILISLKKQMLQPDNEIYLLYSVLILEFSKGKMESFDDIMKEKKNYVNFVKNFGRKNLLKKFEEFQKSNYGIKKYDLIERPWF